MNPANPIMPEQESLRDAIIADLIASKYQTIKPQGLRYFMQGIMQLIETHTAQAVREEGNRSRYVLHRILSEDVDSELDHSDIEEKFNLYFQAQERSKDA